MGVGVKGKTVLSVKRVLALLLALVAIVASFIAGLGSGAGAPEIIQPVLSASSFLNNTVIWLRDNLVSGNNFGLAVAVLAGAAAAFNPCGFVMLPTYLTLYISDSHDTKSPGFAPRIRRGLIVSASLGLGFLVLFGAFGVIFTFGAQSLVRTSADIFPWVGLGLGVILALLGAYLLAGGKIYTGLPQKYAGQIGNAQERSLRGYFLFGISYALASLSCTLPLFLALVATSVASGGFVQGLSQFVAFALGMTAVITVLTLGIAVFKGAMVKPMRSILPFLTPISAGLLIVVGAYLIFYWMTEGGLADAFTF